ncbi:hypothetical protein BH10ACT3_BH10ACT3_15950 [soil metagenome]
MVPPNAGTVTVANARTAELCGGRLGYAPPTTDEEQVMSLVLKGILAADSAPAPGNIAYERMTLDQDHVRVAGPSEPLLQVRASGTVQAQLAPGDIIRGERAKFWPSPFWWHVRFELADDSFDGLRYDAVGVARFLRQLAALPEWDVTTAHRSFIATRVAV